MSIKNAVMLLKVCYLFIFFPAGVWHFQFLLTAGETSGLTGGRRRAQFTGNS